MEDDAVHGPGGSLLLKQCYDLLQWCQRHFHQNDLPDQTLESRSNHGEFGLHHVSTDFIEQTHAWFLQLKTKTSFPSQEQQRLYQLKATASLEQDEKVLTGLTLSDLEQVIRLLADDKAGDDLVVVELLAQWKQRTHDWLSRLCRQLKTSDQAKDRQLLKFCYVLLAKIGLQPTDPYEQKQLEHLDPDLEKLVDSRPDLTEMPTEEDIHELMALVQQDHHLPKRKTTQETDQTTPIDKNDFQRTSPDTSVRWSTLWMLMYASIVPAQPRSPGTSLQTIRKMIKTLILPVWQWSLSVVDGFVLQHKSINHRAIETFRLMIVRQAALMCHYGDTSLAPDHPDNILPLSIIVNQTRMISPSTRLAIPSLSFLFPNQSPSDLRRFHHHDNESAQYLPACRLVVSVMGNELISTGDLRWKDPRVIRRVMTDTLFQSLDLTRRGKPDLRQIVLVLHKLVVTKIIDPMTDTILDPRLYDDEKECVASFMDFQPLSLEEEGQQSTEETRTQRRLRAKALYQQATRPFFSLVTFQMKLGRALSSLIPLSSPPPTTRDHQATGDKVGLRRLDRSSWPSRSRLILQRPGPRRPRPPSQSTKPKPPTTTSSTALTHHIGQSIVAIWQSIFPVSMTASERQEMATSLAGSVSFETKLFRQRCQFLLHDDSYTSEDRVWSTLVLSTIDHCQQIACFQLGAVLPEILQSQTKDSSPHYCHSTFVLAIKILTDLAAIHRLWQPPPPSTHRGTTDFLLSSLLEETVQWRCGSEEAWLRLSTLPDRADDRHRIGRLVDRARSTMTLWLSRSTLVQPALLEGLNQSSLMTDAIQGQVWRTLLQHPRRAWISSRQSVETIVRWLDHQQRLSNLIDARLDHIVPPHQNNANKPLSQARVGPKAGNGRVVIRRTVTIEEHGDDNDISTAITPMTQTDEERQSDTQQVLSSFHEEWMNVVDCWVSFVFSRSSTMTNQVETKVQTVQVFDQTDFHLQRIQRLRERLFNHDTLGYLGQYNLPRLVGLCSLSLVFGASLARLLLPHLGSRLLETISANGILAVTSTLMTLKTLTPTPTGLSSALSASFSYGAMASLLYVYLLDVKTTTSMDMDMVVNAMTFNGYLGIGNVQRIGTSLMSLVARTTLSTFVFRYTYESIVRYFKSETTSAVSDAKQEFKEDLVKLKTHLEQFISHDNQWTLSTMLLVCVDVDWKKDQPNRPVTPSDVQCQKLYQRWLAKPEHADHDLYDCSFRDVVHQLRLELTTSREDGFLGENKELLERFTTNTPSSKAKQKWAEILRTVFRCFKYLGIGALSVLAIHSMSSLAGELFHRQETRLPQFPFLSLEDECPEQGWFSNYFLSNDDDLDCLTTNVQSNIHVIAANTVIQSINDRLFDFTKDFPWEQWTELKIPGLMTLLNSTLGQLIQKKANAQRSVADTIRLANRPTWQQPDLYCPLIPTFDLFTEESLCGERNDGFIFVDTNHRFCVQHLPIMNKALTEANTFIHTLNEGQLDVDNLGEDRPWTRWTTKPLVELLQTDLGHTIVDFTERVIQFQHDIMNNEDSFNNGNEDLIQDYDDDFVNVDLFWQVFKDIVAQLARRAQSTLQGSQDYVHHTAQNLQKFVETLQSTPSLWPFLGYRLLTILISLRSHYWSRRQARTRHSQQTKPKDLRVFTPHTPPQTGIFSLAWSSLRRVGNSLLPLPTLFYLIRNISSDDATDTVAIHSVVNVGVFYVAMIAEIVTRATLGDETDQHEGKARFAEHSNPHNRTALSFMLDSFMSSNMKAKNFDEKRKMIQETMNHAPPESVEFLLDSKR